jgi:hypothetical protein
MTMRIRLEKRKLYLYKDRQTGELLLSEEKVDYPEYELVGEIEAED